MLPVFGVRALDALERDDMRAFIRHMSYARTWFAIRYAIRHVLSVPTILVCRLRENIKRYLTRQCGVVIRTAVRDEAQRQMVRDVMDDLVRNSFMDEWIEHEAGERRTMKDCVAMEQGAITIQWTEGDRAQLDLRDTGTHQEILDAVVHYLVCRHKQLYARSAEESLLPVLEARAR